MRRVKWCERDAFVVYVDDVTDLAAHQKETEELLAISKMQLSAIETLSSGESISVRINQVLETIIRFYEADRVYLFEMDEGGRSMSNTYEKCRQGVEPQQSILQKRDLSLIDRWMGAFSAHQALVQEDTEKIKDSNPDEYALIKVQGISSYLEAPIFRQGKLYGFLGVDNPVAYRLTHSADSLLSLAYSIGNALEKAKADLALANRAEELESIIQNMPLGVSMARLKDGKFLTKAANPFYAALSGVPEGKEEEADEWIRGHLSPEDERSLRERMAALIEPNNSFRFTFAYLRGPKDQDRFYQLDAHSASFGNNENIILTCLSDVTDERRAIEEVHKAQRLYVSATELANLAVWTYDIPNRRIVMTSGEAVNQDLKEYGISKVIENVPEAALAWIDPKDHEKVLAVYRAIQNGAPRASCEYWYAKAKGRKPRCERMAYTTEYDEQGKPIRAIGVGFDITAQVTERESYQQNLRNFFAANPAVVESFRLDLSQNTILEQNFANKASQSFLGGDTADSFFGNVAKLIIDPKQQKHYLSHISCAALWRIIPKENAP